jgi:alpha-L-rhamnosidase
MNNLKISENMKPGLRSFFIEACMLCLLSGMFISCNSNRKIYVSDLKCEYLVNPPGIDIPQPRFSWYISGNRRGTYQSAYRILVSDKKKTLSDGSGNIWDSGKVPSDKIINIIYQGTPLKSDQTYYWSVCVWNQDVEQSPWSKPAVFHTGLLNESDWEANWIASADTSLEAPLFRKEFEIGKQIKNAYVYVTGLGYYELYLNGEKVGDHVLDPTITDYRKRVLYAVYDVTRELKNGVNVVGALLGNGAFRLKKVQGRYIFERCGAIPGSPFAIYKLQNAPRLLMQLNIKFTDGSQTIITTDKSWKSSGSPITFNNLFGGENYDARLEKDKWCSAGFDASDWKEVIIADSPGGILQSQLVPPIKVTETLRPVSKTNPEPGIYLFDMGQNFAGWWRIHVKGLSGVTLRVRGAETLNDSLFPKPLQPGDHLSIEQAYHSNVWTDYILKGEGTEVYEPRFFYTGFRFVEVTMDNHKNPESLEVEGRVVRSALEFNGKFVTSDSLLNRIHRATLWSQMGNTHGFPTDCPHREKGGYTGDGQIVAESSIHDFQMAAFYTKWLNDMRDAQEENGRIPDISPTLIGGHSGGTAWGSAYILIPWWMYQYYNDTRILEEHYVSMKRYLEYLHNLAGTDSNPKEPYIINDFEGFGGSVYDIGEWCAPGQHGRLNDPMVSTFYYYQDASLMSRIATLLGQNTDAGRYLALADTIKNELNKKFFNPNTNLYGADTVNQTCQLLALAGDVVPEGHSEQVFQTITDDIINTRKGHLNTGIIGTKYLWPVMAHSGRSDLAYTVATQTTYPGYGFWIKNGATTLWEEWSGEYSQNHQMFGSVDEFFYKYLAGIRSPEDGTTTNGYKHIHIQPFVPDGLSFVSASLETAAGKIESHWQHKSGVFQLRVVIPANSDASVSIPFLGFKNITVMENGKKVWENGTFIPGNPGITNATIDKICLTFSTSSGTYEFKMSGV